MTLSRWSPWGEMYTLHDQMDQLFQQVFGEPLARSTGTEQVVLPLDIRQTESAYVLEASVPGFSPDDIEVTYDDGALTVRGERHERQGDGDGEYVHRERRTASVLRRVSLPGEVDPDGITATFENGVLTVTVPRMAKAQPKRIPVTAGNPRVVAASAG